MSLIRVRRDRKKNWIDVRTGKSTRTLIFLLILVAVAIWFLGTRF
jgi:hypothetical protein